MKNVINEEKFYDAGKSGPREFGMDCHIHGRVLLKWKLIACWHIFRNHSVAYRIRLTNKGITARNKEFLMAVQCDTTEFSRKEKV